MDDAHSQGEERPISEEIEFEDTLPPMKRENEDSSFAAAIEDVSPTLADFLAPPTEAEEQRLTAELMASDEIPSSPTFPSSLRQRPGATGWVAGDGPVLNPSGEEVDWSDQGHALIAAITEALSTPSCTEIHGYGPNKFSLRVNERNALLRDLRFQDNKEYERFVQFMIEESGGSVAWREIERAGKGVIQMRDGSRLAVVLQPRSPWPLFTIRKHTVKNWDPIEFVRNGTLSQPMLDFLLACVAARANIMIVGQAGSGKTSLARALSQAIGDDERIAVLEQIEELFLTKPLAMPITYRDNIEGETLVDMLDVLLYKGIDRLLVGEVHFNGILRLLETMMLTPGAISTYHARSAQEAGERMLTALQVENESVSPSAGIRLIRKTLDIIVVLKMLNGRHRCSEIIEVDWRSTASGQQLTGLELFVFDPESEIFKGANPPDEHGPLLAKARERGININFAWFQNLRDFERLTKAQRRRG